MTTKQKNILHILDILNIKYKNPKSTQIQCHCPFHKDNHPSMSINIEKRIFHCFSCGKSGTLNTLAKELTGKNLKELIDKNRYNNPFKLKKEKVINTIKAVQKEIKVRTKPSTFLYENLEPVYIRGIIYSANDSELAKKYLLKRKFDLKIIDQYKLLFAEDAVINGTVFTNRLIIPVFDHKGRIVFAEGRDVTGVNSPKCLFPKNSTKVLFDYFNLKKDQPLFIVEGLIDLFHLREDEFFKNSTCVYGNSFAKNNYDLVRFFKLFSEIVIIPDNDDAGEELVKTFKTLLPNKVSIWRINVMFKDVGEVVENGNMKIEEYRKLGGFKKEMKFF